MLAAKDIFGMADNPFLDYLEEAIAPTIGEDCKKQRTIQWEPHPDNKPQIEAFHSTADRLFYGGKAGGGKTDLLLGLALKAHRESIIFRREYTQLKGLIKRSKEIVNGMGRYNSQDKVWNGLPESRSLEFGAVQYEDDVEKYQGRDHDLKAYDEITHFTKYQFNYLTGWNRSTIKGQRSRCVATGNPPTTPEGLWVIEYWGPWLNEDDPLYGTVKPGELVWYAVHNDQDIVVQIRGDRPPPCEVEEDGKTFKIDCHSRTFIPASLEDNPYLAKTNYRSVLHSLPKDLKAALLDGIFSLKFEDDPWQVIPSEWVEMAFLRWEESPTPPCQPTSAGVDVARGGKDETVISVKHGSWFAPLIAYPGSHTPDGESVATQVIDVVPLSARVNIDVVGVGSSVYDIMKRDGRTFPISSGAKSHCLDKTGNMAFYNKRSEMLWKVREALDPDNELKWALPRSNKLKADLCAPRYKAIAPSSHQQSTWNVMYQIVVESKDDIKKRIGRSTDYGDAVAYAQDEGSGGEPMTFHHGAMRRG